ncbi:PhzF family phenazine biosynthesis protein [Corynebacterium callunae]|uniref:PhzF family phenazine biosynthesis protein n=1 Tax=Corynebacterium callunae TaxID=1721 RepID=UPI00398198DD
MRKFFQVDVFGNQPLMGNPLAVFTAADDLSEAHMAAIARWTNLSETTFLLTPTTAEADYRVRIFTPTGELPFAGHPTLGSAHAFLENGGTPRHEGVVIQECTAGLVRVRTAETLAFEAPPTIKKGPLLDAHLQRLCSALGVSPQDVIGHQWVDNGPGWVVLELKSADAVLAVEPDFSTYPEAKVGLLGAYPAGSPAAFEVRAFAPGIGEDPVTGSLNASIAQWLQREGRAGAGYLATQGQKLQRAGEITITIEDETVWVGGSTRTIFRGEAEL